MVDSYVTGSFGWPPRRYQVEFGWDLAADHSGTLTHAVHWFNDDPCTDPLNTFDRSGLTHIREWDDHLTVYHELGRDDFDITAGTNALPLTWTGCGPSTDCETPHFTTSDLAPGG